MLNFTSSRGLAGSDLHKSIGDLVTKSGEDLPSDKALDLYNKAESGQNSISDSHKLQGFFDSRDTSENPKIDNLLQGLGKNPTQDDTRGLANQIMTSGNMDPSQENFMRRTLTTQIGNVNGARDVENLYPTINYGENVPQQVREMASQIRIDKYGTDDPNKLFETIARSTGRLPYEDSADFFNKQLQNMQDIDRVDAEYKSSNSPLDKDTWIKENYPETAATRQKFREELLRLQDLADEQKQFVDHTSGVYSRLKN
jgi:hypothetical protein